MFRAGAVSAAHRDFLRCRTGPGRRQSLTGDFLLMCTTGCRLRSVWVMFADRGKVTRSHLAALPAKPEAHGKGQHVCAPIPGHFSIPPAAPRPCSPSHTPELPAFTSEGKELNEKVGERQKSQECLRAEAVLRRSLQLKSVTRGSFRQQTSHLLNSLASSLALRPTFPPYLFPPTSTS